jgi:hypothetical protein
MMQAMAFYFGNGYVLIYWLKINTKNFNFLRGRIPPQTPYRGAVGRLFISGVYTSAVGDNSPSDPL